MAAWGGLTNSCEKKRNKKQKRKMAIWGGLKNSCEKKRS